VGRLDGGERGRRERRQRKYDRVAAIAGTDSGRTGGERHTGKEMSSKEISTFISASQD
jgi:hypothetical protein